MAAGDRREKGVRLLARRDHSRRELARKLGRSKAGDNDEDDLQQILDEFEARGYLDDRRFAGVFIRRRAEQGYGPRRVMAELRQRGVSDALARQAMAEDEPDWGQILLLLVRKRFGKLAPARSPELARQLRFLQQRGFTTSQLQGVADMPVDDWDDSES